jgi:hypothetical protein
MGALSEEALNFVLGMFEETTAILGRVAQKKNLLGVHNRPSLSRCPIDRLIESLDQLHAASKQLIVRDALLSPPDKHTVQAHAFDSAELLVAQVGIMHCLSDCLSPPVIEREIFHQSFEGTVFSAMPESLLREHVEGDRGRTILGILCEHKDGARIKKAADEPRRCDTVDPGAVPGHPRSAAEFLSLS